MIKDRSLKLQLLEKSAVNTMPLLALSVREVLWSMM